MVTSTKSEQKRQTRRMSWSDWIDLTFLEQREKSIPTSFHGKKRLLTPKIKRFNTTRRFALSLHRFPFFDVNRTLLRFVDVNQNRHWLIDTFLLLFRSRHPQTLVQLSSSSIKTPNGSSAFRWTIITIDWTLRTLQRCLGNVFGRTNERNPIRSLLFSHLWREQSSPIWGVRFISLFTV